MAYQYYLHVVPTTYIAPRSAPLHTAQYSVTHYTRVLDSHRGVNVWLITKSFESSLQGVSQVIEQGREVIVPLGCEIYRHFLGGH